MRFLYLIAAVALVWYAMRLVQTGAAVRRMNERRAAERMRSRNIAPAQDTIACRICGVYVPADSPTACDRGDCPFPKAA